MSEVNPLLLLVVGLLMVGMTIVWGLTIYATARIARRRGLRVRRWVGLAVALGFVTYGPVFLATGYLASSYRRAAWRWVAAQVLALAGVIVAAWLLQSVLKGADLAVAFGLLLAAVALSLAPVLALSLMGPRRLPSGGLAPDKPLIEAGRLHKSYHLGARSLHVLRGVSMSVRQGEFVAILGASGSGKSTLLHLLGLLDVPDSGSLVFDGLDAMSLQPVERDRMRCRDIGFVFQFYHLLPELTVLENVVLPAMAEHGPAAWLRARAAAHRRATELLTGLGLTERLAHRPRELSGGEQQRVAIARALMNQPKLLLADEPTGNLDSQTGGQIIKLLKQLNAETRQTIVLVTHDQALAGFADRIVRLHDGKV